MSGYCGWRLQVFTKAGSDAQGPLMGPGRWQHVRIFGAAVALALISIPLGDPPTHLDALVAGCLVAIAIGASAILVPWERLPVSAQAVPVIAFFLVIALFRHAMGGATSGFTAFTILPAFWLALYGSARQLYAAVAAIGLIHVVPILLVGGPEYPSGEWRRAFLLVVVSAGVGGTVRRLVGTTTAQRDAIARHHEGTRRFGDLLRAVGASDDALPQVCEAAREVTGADAVLVLVPTEDGLSLTSIASAGRDLGRVEVDLREDTAGSATAFRSAVRLAVRDVAVDPTVSSRLAEVTGLHGMLFQPIVRGAQVVGVLVLGFDATLDELDEHRSQLLDLIAAEAATALDRTRLLRELQSTARTDSLTGLPNRRGWDERLASMLATAQRTGEPLSVVLVDLDRFKAYNDTHGHAAGDHLLEQLGTLLAARIRDTDVAARWGGEEFALGLPGCSAADAAAVVGSMRRRLPDHQTFSAGVAQWDGVEPPEALLRRADVALYAAKANGRDLVATSPNPPRSVTQTVDGRVS